MGRSIPHSPRRSSNSFQKLVTIFFKQPGLPFGEVLTAELAEEVFCKHGGLFGLGAIYSTATVLWAFLGQVLQDGKMATCQSAVAGIIAHRQLLGLSVPTEDTGDYCRARSKLNEQALHELACTVAHNTESQAEEHWLAKGRQRNWSTGLLSRCSIPPRTRGNIHKPKRRSRGSAFRSLVVLL